MREGASIDWFVKHWDELTRDELYDLLAVRTAVFVVEQRCPYQEADGLDRRAWHVFARDGEETIQACLRILEPENGTAQIGRVLTVNRGTGLGWSGSSKKRRPRPPLFIFSSWHTAACRDWRC